MGRIQTLLTQNGKAGKINSFMAISLNAVKRQKLCLHFHGIFAFGRCAASDMAVRKQQQKNTIELAQPKKITINDGSNTNQAKYIHMYSDPIFYSKANIPTR